jgi:hypothetical protein
LGVAATATAALKPARLAAMARAETTCRMSFSLQGDAQGTAGMKDCPRG